MLEKNSDGSKWITLKKGILVFKPYSRVRFYFPKAGILKGFKGFVNCRFRIRRGYKNKLVWTIRFPFFYWERDNNNWYFGNNTFYLWGNVLRAE